MKIRLRQPVKFQTLTPERENLEVFLGGPPTPVTSTQLKGVVNEIQRHLGDAMVEAVRLGLRMDAASLEALLDQLIQEASFPGHQPSNDGSIRGYFLEGLFQELVQLPSNIFDRVTAVDGTENYIPLTSETWIAALEDVKRRLRPNK